MEIRTLRPGEREALLGLLEGSREAEAGGEAGAGEGWELPDGWRARDFFRRSLLDDPRVADSELWVAVEDAGPVACVQIFPRRLWVAGHAVPTGGIGTVFTRASHRRRGIAGRLLARAVEAMCASGLELSLLFAERIAWYESLGWHSWACPRMLLRRGEGRPQAPARGLRVAKFRAERDLAEVRALHRRFGPGRPASALREAADWQLSLRHAGNPGEDFLVARAGDDGPLLAYARAAVLEDLLTCLEFGYTETGTEALAELLLQLMAPRREDPLRRRGAGLPRDLRARMLGGPAALDGELQRALRARGLCIEPVVDPSPMLRCLAPAALACRLDGIPPGEPAPERTLAELLPPEHFAFWPADRF